MTKTTDVLSKEKVLAGDVITIDKTSREIIKLDPSFGWSRDHDDMSTDINLVQFLEGEIQKRREVLHTASLHEIDVINSRMQTFLASFVGGTGEVKPEVRNQINAMVTKWCEEGKVEIILGPLHRRGPHTRHCFSFLNRTLKNDLAHLAIMARIRGTIFHSPYRSKPEKTWSK
ncbi:TIP49-domain-containing protein [Armillaria gallica]|uniref:RuvB-like helicase n=1 Tax=Armillaria gallica TaxID=47427 RepID=A0A2H3E8W6_ARMGA|nr:TIP49-domain-containing protein [Armillaria gallica]